MPITTRLPAAARRALWLLPCILLAAVSFVWLSGLSEPAWASGIRLRNPWFPDTSNALWSEILHPTLTLLIPPLFLLWPVSLWQGRRRLGSESPSRMPASTTP